ncbi:protein kinase domain-containing protein [Iningainema tapete]|uniref:non-specific serine/threonine protein kinase n=1 Tax=Iningainema tapete BLCC-T55 TaxID=2748662 RepID=A0A8J6XAW2_9CYAN|nr:YARHG domain-containing protein [Iningainema tapete]MBD2771575.1 YARHG domain-containing protein [Iningainema tapete BLCC-T55]
MLLNNRYRIIRTLGSGGFGETFLAEDTQMPSLRRCVIKQLKPIHNNPQIYQLVQQRFGREAAILEELGGSSDQIPALYAYFQLDGQFYLVQEWIEGETLTAKVRQQGVLSESNLREILASLLPVLEYVHSKGIVHRDIKPDNIILRNPPVGGKPVLIDFGAVRETMGTVMNSQGSPTSSIIIGTPGYMPSEQAMGKPVYASDLYSLGITAIYLLTGKQPQQLATDAQTGEFIWHDTVNVSPTLAAMIDKAIAYHPRDRYKSAQAMLMALQSEANTIPPTQPPPQTVSFDTLPPAEDNRRNRVLMGSAIAGGLIGASVIIGFVLTSSQQSKEQPVVIQTTSSNNYSWLSQRTVTDADLEGKDGFELDVMRNSIFARHGRRFDNPGLQEYFNKQSWYRPIYSSREFPNNLLSELEMQNVQYILNYQDRHNRRFFKK